MCRSKRSNPIIDMGINIICLSKQSRGFTLIEVLISVAIIAILMSILMPALRAAKDHGKRIVCGNHLKTMGLANVLYSDESDGWYVPIMDRVHGEDRYWPNNK